MTLTRQFFSLLMIAFVLVFVSAVQLTYKARNFSNEGKRLTSNLEQTFALNEELHKGIVGQTTLLHHEFDRPDPQFLEKLGRANHELGVKETQYLKLNLGDRERIAVEKLRALHSKLGSESIQIHNQLQSGNRDAARVRMTHVEQLENQIENEFNALNKLQVGNLNNLLHGVNSSLWHYYTMVYTLSGALVLILILFIWMLRRRVLGPIRTLVAASDRIRQEDFSVRAKIVGNDEIGQLAQGFNFMVESLAKSYGQLELRVEQRTQQIRDLQQQLVQAGKMSAMGQLVGGVAHELNNPLTVILGLSELTRLDLAANGGDPKQIELMDDIHLHADRCRKIVANLLQFARQQQLQREAVSINECIEQVLKLREYEFETGNIRLVRRFDPSNPVVYANPDKIQQVILNLVNNAHDAIRETHRPGFIQVNTRLQEGNVIIEVLDNGTGVRQPERVFDPFYTTKEVGKGTGLGLSVCYGIVHEHNGDIRAENWEQGGRFVVVLPAGVPPDQTTDERVVRESPNLQRHPQKRRALVVDDEESLVRLQVSFLTRLGIEASGVASGEQAVRFLQKNNVDLVISDLRMPGSIDGHQLYQWVVKHVPELARRFVFMSGDTLALTNMQLNIDSAVPCIQKPFQFADYSEIVRRILEMAPHR
ncbi:MAG: ATP-binding protein [Acidobacteriota bacterium]